MEKKGTELVKKTVIIAIGNISTKLISFLLLPFYTAVLTTQEYGTYDLLNTYIFLIVPVVGFQLDQAAFKFIVERRSKGKKSDEIVSTTTIFMILQVIVYVVLFSIIYLFMHYEYFIYLGALIIATVVMYDTQQMVRGIGKTALYALGGVVGSTISIILNIVFVTKFKMTIDGLLLSGIISSVITTTTLWLTSRLYNYVHLQDFSKTKLKSLLSFSIPLVPNELAWWLIHASDRTIVSFFLGIAQNGIIAVSQKFSSVYTTVFNIFNMSWTESVILHFKDEDGQQYISKVIDEVSKLFCSCAIGIIAVMPFIFNILINNSYSVSYDLIPLYMIAAMVNVYMALISAVFVAKSETKYIALTTAIAGIINAITHIMLINFIGIYAAPISTITGYSVVFIIRYSKIKKNTTIRFRKSTQLIMAIFFAGTMVFYYLRVTKLQMICLIFDIIVCFVLNKPLLANLVDQIKQKVRN